MMYSKKVVTLKFDTNTCTWGILPSRNPSGKIRTITSSITFALVVGLSRLPAASACTPSYFVNCGISQQKMISVTASCVAIVVFLLIFALAIWRRRRLQRRVICAIATANVPQSRLSSRPKPQYTPPNPNHYSVYYQTGPPAPPPAHIPQYPQYSQYPPHDFSTYNSYSGSQTLSTSSGSTIPRPTAPSSPVSMPTSPLAVTPPLERRESSTVVPTPVSPSPRRTQENVTLSSPPSVPSSPPPRSPLVPPQPSRTSLNPFSAAPPPNAARQALSPMHTGVSNNVIDEPPPAYTPI